MNTPRKISSCLGALALLPMLLASVHANSYTWSGKTNTDLSEAANWTPNGVPTNGDAILFADAEIDANKVVAAAPIAANTGLAALTVMRSSDLTFALSSYIRMANGSSFTVASGSGAVVIGSGRLLFGSGADGAPSEFKLVNSSANPVTWASGASGDILGGTGTRNLNFFGAGDWAFYQSIGISNVFTLNLNMQGKGTLTLAGKNMSFGGNAETGEGAGSITVARGTVSVAHENALGDGPRAVSVNIAGGKLSSSVASIKSAGNLTLSEGSLDLNNTGVGTLQLKDSSTFNMTGGTWIVTIGNTGRHDQIRGARGGVFSISGGAITLNGSIDYATSFALFSGFSSGLVSNLSIGGYDKTKWTARLSESGVLSFSPVGAP